MNTVAIVQARLGSTRLPRKVLMNLGGQTVLERVIGRLQRCRQLDEVVVATTTDPSDDEIVLESQRLCTRVTRGSETDVLSRYFESATEVAADLVVRVTSDCPLIDPKLIDRMVRHSKASSTQGHAYDYFSNVRPRSFPRGLDAEVMTYESLYTAHYNGARVVRTRACDAPSVSASRDISDRKYRTGGRSVIAALDVG